MKHIGKIFFGAFAAMAMLVSCQREVAVVQDANDNLIRFGATVGTFDVKATDTAFETGDEVGVLAPSLGINNEKLTWTGGKLVPDTPLSWGDTPKNQKVHFMAYYPYTTNIGTEGGFSIDFTVKADQSTHANYTASDFMVAGDEYAPADGVVNFKFQHFLSKVVVKIDNRLPASVKDVYFKDVYGSVHLVAGTDDFEIKGTKGQIKACPVMLADGNPAWALILIPAQVTPTLIITTVDNQVYTYTVKNPISFRSGYRYIANVVLSEESISTDFGAEIEDWVGDEEIQFGQDDDDPGQGDDPGTTDKWYGNWTFNLQGAYQSGFEAIDIYPDDYNYYTLYVTSFWGNANQKLMLYVDGENVMFGQPTTGTTQNSVVYGYRRSSSGEDITLKANAFYELIVNAGTETVSLHQIAADGVSDLWSVTGSIDGLQWTDDLPMYPTKKVVKGDESVVYPAYRVDFNYGVSEAFKIRFQKAWNYDFGAATTDPYSLNYPIGLVPKARDIYLNDFGKFYAVFDWEDKTLTVFSDEGGSGGGQEAEPGTADNPASVAQVLEWIKQGMTGNAYYVTGKVSEFVSYERGEAVLYINDNGVAGQPGLLVPRMSVTEQEAKMLQVVGLQVTVYGTATNNYDSGSPVPCIANPLLIYMEGSN